MRTKTVLGSLLGLAVVAALVKSPLGTMMKSFVMGHVHRWLFERAYRKSSGKARQSGTTSVPFDFEMGSGLSHDGPIMHPGTSMEALRRLVDDIFPVRAETENPWGEGPWNPDADAVLQDILLNDEYDLAAMLDRIPDGGIASEWPDEQEDLNALFGISDPNPDSTVIDEPFDDLFGSFSDDPLELDDFFVDSDESPDDETIDWSVFAGEDTGFDFENPQDEEGNPIFTSEEDESNA